MIKPEDISDEAFAKLSHVFCPDTGIDKDDFSTILNAAIAAGLVSPPCYCLRWDGELQMNRDTEPVTPKVFPGTPWAADTEHYQGQTK